MLSVNLLPRCYTTHRSLRGTIIDSLDTCKPYLFWASSQLEAHTLIRLLKPRIENRSCIAISALKTTQEVSNLPRRSEIVALGFSV
jgi:hypothetical protein